MKKWKNVNKNELSNLNENEQLCQITHFDFQMLTESNMLKLKY